MADLLAEYEQQFASITADITAKTCILFRKDGEEKQCLVSETHKLVEEAKELMERMDLEIRDSPPSLRDRHSSKLKSYSVELSRLEGEFTRARKADGSEREVRDALMEGGSLLSNDDEQKQSLLQNSETLDHTSERLTQGYRVALETEQVGALILNDLHDQRQTITRARDRLREADNDLDQSSRVLGKMMRRAMQNKFVMYVVIISVVIAIITAIYLALRY